MTINQLINEVNGVELQPIVRQSIAETNSVLAGCNVHWIFRGSVVDLETGRNGLRWLIARILKESGAVQNSKFVPVKKADGYIDETQPFRKIFIGCAMTTDAIIAKVRSINGFDKYPDSTIMDTLCIVMKRSNQVASVQMTANEDVGRTCKRPRSVWYLLEN